MKVRDKNAITKGLVEGFRKKGIAEGNDALKAIASALNRPRSARHEVNVGRIGKFAGQKETIVVPGIVLGGGEIGKKVDVFAVRFSGDAREKIEKAGGKCLDVRDLKGGERNIRIMG